MKRQQLRDLIRTQTDLDEEDLPDPLVDAHLEEAFYRTAALERRWPMYEHAWDAVTVDGVASFPVAPVETIAELAAVTVAGDRLTFVDHDWAESAFYNYAAGSPKYFSVWGSNLYVWPKLDGDVGLRGWRSPNPSWITDPALEVDLDVRLHMPLSHYAVSLAYSYQEDPELENLYMNRWGQQVEAVRRDIMQASAYTPIILNGGVNDGEAPTRFWVP